MINELLVDCEVNILINYITHKVFWSSQYSVDNVRNTFVQAGKIWFS